MKFLGKMWLIIILILKVTKNQGFSLSLSLSLSLSFSLSLYGKHILGKTTGWGGVGGGGVGGIKFTFLIYLFSVNCIQGKFHTQLTSKLQFKW